MAFLGSGFAIETDPRVSAFVAQLEYIFCTAAPRARPAAAGRPARRQAPCRPARRRRPFWPFISALLPHSEVSTSEAGTSTRTRAQAGVAPHGAEREAAARFLGLVAASPHVVARTRGWAFMMDRELVVQLKACDGVRAQRGLPACGLLTPCSRARMLNAVEVSSRSTDTSRSTRRAAAADGGQRRATAGHDHRLKGWQASSGHGEHDSADGRGSGGVAAAARSATRRRRSWPRPPRWRPRTGLPTPPRERGRRGRRSAARGRSRSMTVVAQPPRQTRRSLTTASLSGSAQPPALAPCSHAMWANGGAPGSPGRDRSAAA